MFEAFLLGFLGSWHCALMCGGFLWGARPWPYLVGRLLGYACVGAALGWGGHWLLGYLGSRLLLGLSGLMLLFMARARGPVQAQNKATLLGFVLKELGPWLRAPGPRARFLLGLVTAVFPCGLLSAAWLMAMNQGTPSRAAISMVWFALGSTPGLMLPRWLGRLGGAIAPVALYLASGWMLMMALWPEAGPGAGPLCH
ncbi:sulfite exporter TauE/SafE family protein [bacterium]|nr:sulfite exporter TauE/SafE family protein [bacterium]